MLRLLAIVSCVGLLVQSAVGVAQQGSGPRSLMADLFEFLLFLAPALSLIALVRPGTKEAFFLIG